MHVDATDQIGKNKEQTLATTERNFWFWRALQGSHEKHMARCLAGQFEPDSPGVEVLGNLKTKVLEIIEIILKLFKFVTPNCALKYDQDG